MKNDERKFIHRSLDGELNMRETRVFRRKLESDLELRREYEQLKAIDESSIRAIKPIDLPKNFVQKVLGRIRSGGGSYTPE